MPERGRPLYERANSYYFLTAAFGGVGVLPYFLGASEVPAHHDIWRNGWVRVGLVFWVLSLAALGAGIIVQVVHAWRTIRRNRSEGRTQTAAQRRKTEERLLLGVMKAREAAIRKEAARLWIGRAQPNIATAGMIVELHCPRSDDPLRYKGAMATCVVTQSQNLFRPIREEPIEYIPTWGAFVTKFPDDFLDFVPPHPAREIHYCVWWESAALPGGFRMQRFVVERHGHLIYEGLDRSEEHTS